MTFVLITVLRSSGGPIAFVYSSFGLHQQELAAGYPIWDGICDTQSFLHSLLSLFLTASSGLWSGACRMDSTFKDDNRFIETKTLFEPEAFVHILYGMGHNRFIETRTLFEPEAFVHLLNGISQSYHYLAWYLTCTQPAFFLTLTSFVPEYKERTSFSPRVIKRHCPIVLFGKFITIAFQVT